MWVGASKGLCTAILSATLLASCNSTGGVDQQTLTTIGGGVLGGAIGSRFGGGAGKVLTTVGGTLAGAWLGNQLGAYLNERDREAAAGAAQKAVVTGQPQNWTNPQTGVQGRVSVANAPSERKVVSVPVKKDKVSKLPPLDMINKPYTVIRTTDLRSGPGTDKPVVGSLAGGREVVAVGKAKGTNWYLISEDGVGTGFVSASSLRAADRSAAAPTQPAPALASSDVEVQQVTATQNCRTVTQTIVLANGQEHREDVKSCEGPNGWEVVS